MPHIHDPAVKQAVAKASREGAKELDLSDLGLTEFPEVLSQLTHLESINLANNPLEAVPEALRQLQRLKKLDLTGNQLKSLPSWMGELTQLQSLDVSENQLDALPDWIGQLTNLQWLSIDDNQLTSLPDALGGLSWLSWLRIGSAEGGNPFREVPPVLRKLEGLRVLIAFGCGFTVLPEWFGELTNLEELSLKKNELADIPVSIAQLPRLRELSLDYNPLNPELKAAHGEGLDAILRYLRARAEARLALYEAKLILVGEGEVGKSSLLSALRGDDWEEDRPTTHGIEIKSVKVSDPDTGIQITFNGWDFGGQRVYRPTHQLFFSAPAVYLVIWKPREGPQQGLVREWIKLIKHREPDAKILVIATHGGPGQRQPDVDRQEIWDLFGRETVADFHLVDSKPDPNTAERLGIAALKDAIARLAASLPEMGRTVPARWQQTLEQLRRSRAAYLPLDSVLELGREQGMEEEEARDFVRVSHRLGHLIHYEHDLTLRDIVILKPDWLATAISFVLDDKQTRDAHGLVSFQRLSQLWNDPAKDEETHYPAKLHPIFLRLMERFDLSYRVAGLSGNGHPEGSTSLIAQLVPDVRPEADLERSWPAVVAEGDEQQVQICRIVETRSGESSTAEGLFYQLVVRLHRYSLGRENYANSVHWQRGLVLDDNFNGRALLEHVGNDVRITVRAPYPERFLSALTYEVKWLVESFWEGLRCDVMVPCVEPCGRGAPGTGLFDVAKLIDSKKRQRPDYPCPVCDEWQDINCLLRNAPAAQPAPAEKLFAGFSEVKDELSGVRRLLIVQHGEAMGRFDGLDVGLQRLLSQVDEAFSVLMQTLIDEAKEGPRLFSFQPIDPTFFDRPKWINQKFRLTLWCEHSRLPLPALNGQGDRRGVYDLNLPRDWFVKAAPFFKVLTGTLSLVLPVASSATKLVLDDEAYKGIEEELDLGQKSIESVIKGSEGAGGWLSHRDAPDLEHGEAIEARGAILRQLHAMLKEKDPSFGGLIRVRNKRQEFLWVHPHYEREY